MTLKQHKNTHPLCSKCGKCLFNHLCAVEQFPDGRPTCGIKPASGEYDNG